MLFLSRLFPAALLMLAASGERIPLHFSYITAKTGSFITSGAFPVVDLALEQINNSTEILSNYTLSYTTILDSECTSTASLDAFMEHFRSESEPTYISLFCCGCSGSTISVAEISHYWNIPHMASISNANELSNRQRFRSYFRTASSTEFIGPALAEMARHFNWTQMAIISNSQSLHAMTTETLSSIFVSEGRVLDTSITFDKDTEPLPYHLLDELEARDFRIIILNVELAHVYSMLCEGYYRGWVAPQYVWLTYNWFDNGWWDGYTGNSSCTPEIMRMMINGSLAFLPENNLVSEDRQIPTLSGLTPEAYEQEYRARLQEEHYQDLTEFILAGSEYDAMWAMALGLHEASERVQINDSSGCDHLPGELVPLEQFDYLNEKMGCVFRESFQRVTFRGITGPVMFNSNGSRDDRVISIYQYRVSDAGRVDKIPVAEIVVGTNSSEWIFMGDLGPSSLWEGGVPYDGAARDQLHLNSPVLVYVYSIAALAGIIFAAVCLVFNIVFRNRKVLKLSSRNLNYLIIAGAVLLYICVYLYILSERDLEKVAHDALCNIRQGLFTFGYTLCFAVILAKTWRVYHIYFNPKPKKKVPKDWFLFVLVVLVVAGDLLIVLLGTVIPSSRLRATRVADIQHPLSYEEGITYENYVFVCLNKDAIVWLAISYAYKGLLQLAAMFMAFHTRRVKIKGLNDSKEIVVIVYINSIILALLAVVEFALASYHEVHAALVGLALLTEATVFLSLVFIPRMIQLYKDPQGEKVLDVSSAMNTNQIKTLPANGSDSVHQNGEIAGLKHQVLELEKRLAEADSEDQKDMYSTDER